MSDTSTQTTDRWDAQRSTRSAIRSRDYRRTFVWTLPWTGHDAGSNVKSMIRPPDSLNRITSRASDSVMNCRSSARQPHRGIPRCPNCPGRNGPRWRRPGHSPRQRLFARTLACGLTSHWCACTATQQHERQNNGIAWQTGSVGRNEDTAGASSNRMLPVSAPPPAYERLRSVGVN